MPILIILLLAALVATYGFWDTLQAILGAIGVIILLWLIFVAVLAAIGAWLFRRSRRRFTGR